ncbi:MAG TPA: putative glycoside hydrolase [Solirubrobacteraceae bacterium]|nr:putative glycoside hydrolase [Solirubrobacteraceae bacterium]
MAFSTIFVGFSTVFVGQATADTAGAVHFVRFAEPSFDQYLENPSPSTQSWLNTHVWRMGVYAPYFDSKTAWYPNGWLYKDSYALYTDENIASQHPEWVLRDTSGNPLYIQWGCSNGTCPQYAANITNQAFRQWWINNAKAELSAGYRGLFIDDVNMEMRVSNGREEVVAPIDPSTGQPMTATAWRGYMAQFMQEIRSMLPGTELVHNAIWYSDGDAGTSDASIRSEISASNFVYLERGVNDSGLTGGDGRWSLNAMLSFIDQVHALGKGVVVDGKASDPAGLEYNLASYFLVSTGNDAVSGGGQTPNNWWAGYNTNLGEATGLRHSWNGLLRRDFTSGMVLVNPPNEPTRTVTLTTPMQNVNGGTMTSVTLPAASGAILVGTPPAATSQPKTPTPTETTVETKPVVGSPSLSPSGSSSAESSTTATPTKPTPSRHKSGRHKSQQHARLARTARAHRARHRAVPTLVKGSVKRASRGHVSIQLEARLGNRWTHARILTTSVNAKGRFTHLFDLKPTVRYRVRALYKGAPGYRPSRSGYRQIAPRAR